MNKKHIIAIDLFLVVGSLAVLAGFMGYSSPLVIAPLDGHESANSSVVFEFEKAERILIDDNIEFSSPEIIDARDNLVINLKPGVYYWKAEGFVSSEVRKLTIVSEVSLKIKNSDDKYELVNAGNTILDVDIYEKENLSGRIVLGVDESREVSGTKFIGRENEQ